MSSAGKGKRRIYFAPLAALKTGAPPSADVLHFSGARRILAAMNTTQKTNVMRLLDAAGIAYEIHSYPVDETDLSAVHAAQMLGLEADSIFKTLVLQGEKTKYFVCCMPGAEEIDLKKAARAVGDKKVEMLPMKELLGVAGYVRGACSPIGMKKKFPLFIDETCELYDKIAVSAGVRGTMLLVSPEALIRYTGAEPRDLIQY